MFLLAAFQVIFVEEEEEIAVVEMVATLVIVLTPISSLWENLKNLLQRAAIVAETLLSLTTSAQLFQLNLKLKRKRRNQLSVQPAGVVTMKLMANLQKWGIK